ncbi:MAG TPA: heparan-alpha-glucosaminide N-acetyltransferase domain-containing protein, partial [Planctomycetia bacterium]|nr:heparan-alpha-glucosaminide N-acetyltransferase domain-containing protein [Planctomycetia bacterium]
MSIDPGAKAPGAGERLASLDQFRGYTVLGMLLVNFVGGFALVKPTILAHHHVYCSYADTIMPQFLFAVGFAARLVFLKRLAAGGARASYVRAIRRSIGLFLLAAVWYELDRKFGKWDDLVAAWTTEGPWRFILSCFEREPFQTLAHIAVASLWTLPVIAASWRVRLLFLAGSVALHAGLSHWQYFDPLVRPVLSSIGLVSPEPSSWNYLEWVTRRPGIDGGPLGFLTWSIPLLVGTFAHDLVRRGWGPLRLALLGAAIAFAAYAASC